MKFNPETALAYARALARPRLLGSGEDGAVAQEIAAQLEGFGCRVERQPFQFSAAFNTFVRLEVLAGQLLILAAFWAWSRSTAPWASILPAALLLALLVLIEPLNRAVEAGSLITPKSETPRSDSLSALWQAVCQRMGAKYHTANLVAGWPSLPDAPNLPHFYLVAHYDSKSQFIPIIARVILFMLVSGGAAVFAILSLLRLALPALTPFAAVVGLTALLAGLPLLLLDVGNASPGAIDNASGCGLVLGLAER
ncbi:MAG: hypothetical protein ACRDH2_16790, partial [Anaerolineales bacterium]